MLSKEGEDTIFSYIFILIAYSILHSLHPSNFFFEFDAYYFYFNLILFLYFSHKVASWSHAI